MIKKLLYSIAALIKLSLKLNNPLVMINYLFQRSVRLNFKNGLILKTNQILDAVMIKEIIIDDDYQISAIRQPMKTIIDIGAGLGEFAITVAKKFPQAEIIAFEPNPDQFKLLKENIFLNKVKNVKIFNLAIGTKKSYNLYLSAFNVHSSIFKNKRSNMKIKVIGKKLNEFIRSPIDLLKIDCEGAEIDILESISKNKMGLIKRIIIEYHNNIIKNEDKKILAILNNWQYKIIIKKNILIPSTGLIFAENK